MAFSSLSLGRLVFVMSSMIWAFWKSFMIVALTPSLLPWLAVSRFRLDWLGYNLPSISTPINPQQCMNTRFLDGDYRRQKRGSNAVPIPESYVEAVLLVVVHWCTRRHNRLSDAGVMVHKA